MEDKYKVETLSYIYEWINVGPGPSVRGNVSRMSSMLRSYRKTPHDLKIAVKEFERLRKRSDEDVVIISKLIDKQYVPGKVVISSKGIPSWQLVDNFYNYGWKRLNTKEPFFRITMDDEVPNIVSQKWFFEKKLTFSELVKTGVLDKAFRKEMYDGRLPLLNLMGRYRRNT